MMNHRASSLLECSRTWGTIHTPFGHSSTFGCWYRRRGDGRLYVCQQESCAPKVRLLTHVEKIAISVHAEGLARKVVLGTVPWWPVSWAVASCCAEDECRRI